MSKILDYQILTGTDPDFLSEEVQEYVLEGWQLSGSLCMVGDSDFIHYAQALVKYAK